VKTRKNFNLRKRFNIRKRFNLKTIISGEFERYKIYEKPVVIPENNGYTGERGKAKNQEKSVRQAIKRAKEKIYGYIIANEWEYWATQTFSPKAIDRYNLDEIVRRYNQKLKDLRRRKYSDLKWLIVPEQHKDGAWHLHAFMSGIPADKVVYSGYDYFNKKKTFSRRIYNWVDMIDYGFNDYLHIGNCNPLERFKMANYVMKYITKELAQKRFNKKMYWCSRGLKKPTITNTLTINKEKYISSTGVIISQSKYYIKDDNTGEIFNTVNDITVFNPLPF
jgi:hypothetical protein